MTELPLHLKFSDIKLSDSKFSDTKLSDLKCLGHKALRLKVLGHKARRAEKEIGKGGNTHRKQIVSPERSEQEKSHEVKLRSVSRAFSSHNPWENEEKALHTTTCAATAQSKA